MREFLDNRNRRDIQRIARVSLEGPNPALTQDYLIVPTGHNVLSREQQLFQRRGNPALQQDGLAHFPQLTKQVEVLHIPRADLKDVNVRQHQLNL